MLINTSLSVNNAEIYEPPALMDDGKFEVQCEETLKINYFGVKKVIKTFKEMMTSGGRLVNCSSHLGHLSNLDGREPQEHRYILISSGYNFFLTFTHSNFHTFTHSHIHTFTLSHFHTYKYSKAILLKLKYHQIPIITNSNRGKKTIFSPLHFPLQSENMTFKRQACCVRGSAGPT